jgi:hypothetical protein
VPDRERHYPRRTISWTIVVGGVAVGSVMPSTVFAARPHAGATAADPPPLVAHWDMNEHRRAKILHDVSGNGYDGTIGRRVIRSGTNHRFTPIAYGVKQNGRVDVVPDAAGLDPGDAPFSVRVTFKWPGNYDNNLIQKGQGSPAGGMFKMKTTVPAAGQPPGYLKCLFRGSIGDSQVESYAAPRVDDGKWHTVLCRRTTTHTVMRLDGTVVDTNPKDPGTISNDWPIAIGGDTSCASSECNFWWGRIGDVRWSVQARESRVNVADRVHGHGTKLGDYHDHLVGRREDDQEPQRAYRYVSFR